MSSTLINQHILEMSNVLFHLLSEISICQLCTHGERYGVLLLLLLMGLLRALAIWGSSSHGLTLTLFPVMANFANTKNVKK